MKKIKKLVAILLALTLTIGIAACNGGQNANSSSKENVAMGRYVEKDFDMPPMANILNVAAIHKMPDGRLGMLVNSDLGQQDYYSTDGKDWRQENSEWMKELIEKELFIQSISYNSSGDCAINAMGMEDNNYRSVIYMLNADGTVTRSTIGDEMSPGVNGGMNFGITHSEANPDRQEGEALEPADNANPNAGETIVQDIIGIPEGEAPSNPDEAKSEENEAGEENEENSSMSSMVFDETFYTHEIILGDDGLVYAQTYNGISSYDPKTGREVQRYSTEGYVSGFVLLGDEVLLMDGFNFYSGSNENPATDALRFYSTKDGKETRTLTFEHLMGPGNDMLTAGKDGDLFITNEKGLFHLAAGGDVWEQIIDGALCSLSLPSTRVTAVYPHGDSEYLMLLEDNIPYLVNYSYDPQTPTRPSTELNIYAMRRFDTVRQAIGIFRQKHPDILVNYSIALEGSAVSGDDILKVWNTELLAGKGPDIMLMDDRDDIIKSYAEKGVLADLSPIIEEMISEGALYENIVRAFTDDGKIYAVPARFSFPTIWGEPEAVSAAGSLKTLAEWSNANPDKRLFTDMKETNLTALFLPMYQSEWYKEDGQLNEQAIAEFLTDIKNLSGSVKEKFLAFHNGQETSEIYYNSNPKDFIEFDSIFSFAQKKASALPYYVQGYESIMIPNGALFAYNGGVMGDFEGEEQITSVTDSEIAKMYGLLCTQRPGIFLPSTIVGVNNASTQKELAMEFVQGMLSEEVQSVELGDGFPVNRKAAEHHVSKKEDMTWSWGWGDEDGNFAMLDMGWPSHGVLRAVSESFDKLDTPVILSEAFLGSIREYAQPFFDGNISAEDAAHHIAESMKWQLAE